MEPDWRFAAQRGDDAQEGVCGFVKNNALVSAWTPSGCLSREITQDYCVLFVGGGGLCACGCNDFIADKKRVNKKRIVVAA